MSKEEKEEVEIQKTETFTERFVTNAIITHTPDSNFILDFGRPVIGAYAEKKSGKILGHKGELKLDVRLFMSHISAKRLLKALKSNIEGYESSYGEIKVGEQENEVNRE
jgi:hypothetical protein